MIKVNNVYPTDVIPDFHFLDYTIGAPKIKVNTRERTARHGSDFIRSLYDSRDIIIRANITKSTLSDRELLRNALLSWAQSSSPRQMLFDNIADKYLMVQCTQMPDFEAYKWWNEFTIIFTAFDPFFVSIAMTTATIGDPFSIIGDVEPIGNITQTIAAPVATNPQWTLDGGKSIILNGTTTPVPAGDLIIELGPSKKVVTLDGYPIMNRLSISSRFFDLAPGDHTITASNGAGGNINWYERWL